MNTLGQTFSCQSRCVEVSVSGPATPRSTRRPSLPGYHTYEAGVATTSNSSLIQLLGLFVLLLTVKAGVSKWPCTYTIHHG